MELYDNRNLPETGIEFEQRIEKHYYKLLEQAELLPQAVERLTVGDILNTVVYYASGEVGEEVRKEVGEELGVTLTKPEIEIVNSIITEVNKELTDSILESRDSLWKNRVRIKPKDIGGILTETAKEVGDNYCLKLKKDKETYQGVLDRKLKLIEKEKDKLKLHKISQTVRSRVISLEKQEESVKRELRKVEIKLQATKKYTEMVVGTVEKPNRVIKQGLRSAAEIMSGKPPLKSQPTPVESLRAYRSEGERIKGERTPLKKIVTDANKNYSTKGGEKAPSRVQPPINPEITM